MTWIMPFPESKITGHYGTLSDYRRERGMQPHSGTDWAAPSGTLIPAIADGEVKLIQWSRILGWVVVQTATDKDGNLWYLGYCHLTCSKHGDRCKGDHASPLTKTKVGDKVKVGQKYLRIGNTGSATTGPHLHATASRTLKGVFGVTSAKADLYKLIQSNSKGTAPKQAPKKTQAVVQPAPQIIYACPHCKKELK